jgi:hypothetical protein
MVRFAMVRKKKHCTVWMYCRRYLRGVSRSSWKEILQATCNLLVDARDATSFVFPSSVLVARGQADVGSGHTGISAGRPGFDASHGNGTGTVFHYTGGKLGGLMRGKAIDSSERNRL